MGKDDGIAKYCQTIGASARSMFAQAMGLLSSSTIGDDHAHIGISDCAKMLLALTWVGARLILRSGVTRGCAAADH
ncbi:hypothetical protein BH11PSE4_BH11PSE4_29500 [soil metagenome]